MRFVDSLFSSRRPGARRAAGAEDSGRVPVTAALLMGLGAVVSFATWPQTAMAQNSTAQPPNGASLRRFDIPAGPLHRALDHFARVAQVNLAYEATLVNDRNTPGLTGSYSVGNGLRLLLAGSELEALEQPGGGYSLRAKNPVRSGVSADTLPTVMVQAHVEKESANGRVLGHVARRSATATKTDTLIVDIPQSISVIGAREMEDKGANNLTEVVEQTPGVAVNPYGYDPRVADWVVLRGFDGWYTSSYRDGLAQTVGITYMGVPTEIYGLERLEVLRGPASMVFGKGDVGGVVNRVSKLPSGEAGGEMQVQLGSYGRRQLAFDVQGPLGSDSEESSKVQYRIVGLDLNTATQEAYPDGTRATMTRQYLAPSLRWDLSARTRLVLQAEYLRDNAPDDIQYVSSATGLPTDIKEGDPSYSRIKTNTDAFGYQFEHRLEGDWLLRQKTRYAQRTMDKHHILSWFDSGDNVTLNRQARHDVESVDELSTDTATTGLWKTGSVAHTLLLGVEWSQSLAQWKRWSDMTSSLNMNNPVYGVAIAEPTTLAANTAVSSVQTGLYAQDQLQLNEHWGLVLGVRRDQVRSVTDDRYNATRQEQNDWATSSRIGANYRVGNGWVPYVSYSESFVPNLGVDGSGYALVPSVGRQYELGAKYMPEASALLLTAAVFDLQKSNVVTYDQSTYEARQIGKVRSRGVELEAKAELSSAWRVTASYTVLDLKVVESANTNEVGHRPILVPEQTGSVWLDYAVGAGVLPGLNLGGGVRYIGKRWDDEANTSSEQEVALLDLGGRYATGPWLFSINLRNVLDKHYYAAKAYGSFFRGEERNVVLTVKYRF
jgi:iron complex outermembrane receptor protein